MTKCPICAMTFPKSDYDGLAKHIVQMKEKNDPFHSGWLRDYVPMDNYDVPDFVPKLKAFYNLTGTTLSDWMFKVFINKFYGVKPHPFVETMQRPKKSIFLGFGVEYYFFLKEKIRTLSYVIAKTDKEDVQKFEAKILLPELLNDGTSGKSRTTLLLKMCDSLGVNKDALVSSAPLPPTIHSIKLWNSIAETENWVEVMASINPLDILYSPAVKKKGAKLFFYGDSVMENEWIPETVKEFLAYLSDPANDYAEAGLKLLEQYAKEIDDVEGVQSTFVRSIDALDRHLIARVTRAKQYESKS